MRPQASATRPRTFSMMTPMKWKFVEKGKKREKPNAT
jgi:hypothetical protein